MVGQGGDGSIKELSEGGILNKRTAVEVRERETVCVCVCVCVRSSLFL